VIVYNRTTNSDLAPFNTENIVEIQVLVWDMFMLSNPLSYLDFQRHCRYKQTNTNSTRFAYTFVLFQHAYTLFFSILRQCITNILEI